MNIILCEPDQYRLNQINQMISIWGKEHSHLNSITVHSFDSSEELINAWKNGLPIDILMVAVAFPCDYSGFETARQIQSINRHIPVVLVSNEKNIAFDHYHAENLRFLLEPVAKELFDACMNLCWVQASENQQDMITLKDLSQVVRIRKSDIMYIEHSGRHTVVHVADHETPFYINCTLQHVAEALPEELFLRCHKSYYVNRLYVSQIKNKSVFLFTNHCIPIGKSYYSAFIKQIRKDGNG